MVNAASRARGPGDAEPFWPILAVTANKPRSSTDVNTTSHYSSGAVEYATSLHGSTTVVLIDG